MDNREYDNRCLTEAYQHMQRIEKAPLSERKEAAKEFYDAMKTDPALIAERLGWLFDGNYGRGEQLKAQQILGMNARANKAASLTQMIGAYEWQSPPAMTIAMWKKLSKAEKDLLDEAVKIVIAEAEKEMREDS